MRRTFFGPRLTRRERLKRRLGATVLATGASLLIGIPAGIGSLGALSSLTGASAPAGTTPARGVEPPAASQGPLTMSVRFLPCARPGCVVPAIPGITLL